MTQKAAFEKMMDLDTEKVVSTIKIINLDAKVSVEKAMVVLVFWDEERQYSYGNSFDESGYNGVISDCCTGISNLVSYNCCIFSSFLSCKYCNQKIILLDILP